LQEADLQLLLDAGHEAGAIAKLHFKNDPEVWEKGDGQGPVTAADLAINDMLTTKLRAARPDYGWLSEETEDNSDRQAHETIFIVDPIDGTRSFINGHENFSHALAVAHNGFVTAAVVHLPIKNLTYWASLGGGAFRNGERISHSEQSEVLGARVLASGSQFRADLWPGGPPPVERHFRSSLAYRMCLVADGRFDGMVTIRDAWDWDVAAGCLICSEAGAISTTRTGEMPLFNKTRPSQAGMLAASPKLHERLMEHL
jgi:myo-inositol-1(or 4)-monophosphatase